MKILWNGTYLSFWYQIQVSGEACVTCWKSSLIFTTFEMLISILIDKAVLGTLHNTPHFLDYILLRGMAWKGCKA